MPLPIANSLCARVQAHVQSYMQIWVCVWGLHLHTPLTVFKLIAHTHFSVCLFIFKKPLHAPLNCTHLWYEMQQLFNSTQQQFIMDRIAIYHLKLYGEFQVGGMQLPKSEFGQDTRLNTNILEKNARKSLAITSGQDLYFMSLPKQCTACSMAPLVLTLVIY